jgi:hypothetical protein
LLPRVAKRQATFVNDWASDKVFSVLLIAASCPPGSLGIENQRYENRSREACASQHARSALGRQGRITVLRASTEPPFEVRPNWKEQPLSESLTAALYQLLLAAWLLLQRARLI